MTIVPLIAHAAESAGSGNIFLETIVYPIIALSVFFLLAMVTLSYRHVANRHSSKSEAYAKEHAADSAQTGHDH